MKLYASLLTLCLLHSPAVLADSLRVVSEAWPPYVFEQDGKVLGADVEVADHVLRQLGHQTRWELMPWKRALRTVERGKADAILDLSLNEERRDTYLFPSEPLSTSDTVLFYHRDRPHTFEDIDDLTGLTIGISPGYAYANEAFMQAEHFIREPGPTLEANMRKLLRGRLDMVLMNRSVGLFIAHQLGADEQIVHHSNTISSGELYLAFHRSDALAPIAAAFGPALQAFKQTPEYAAILARYGQSASQTTVSADPVH